LPAPISYVTILNNYESLPKGFQDRLIILANPYFSSFTIDDFGGSFVDAINNYHYRNNAKLPADFEELILKLQDKQGVATWAVFFQMHLMILYRI